MKKCILCNKYNNLNSIRLCSKCGVNPFNIERARSYYALRNNNIFFLKTYSAVFKTIPDLNTPRFWDKKLNKISKVEDQDGMTKSRLYQTVKFTPHGKIKILDIGAGHGYLEELLSIHRKEAEIYATDFSKDSVNNLKSRFKGNFRIESIYKLNWKEEFFDAVYTLEVLEHIKTARIFSVLKSINRIIKKNGLFILSVPSNENLEFMKANPSGHVRDYKLEIISKELELSGFKIVSYKKFYAFKNNYKLKSFIAKYINKWNYNNIVIKAIKR